MNPLIASEADAAFYRPCAGIMLINESGCVWVGERIDFPGAWQMPQGGINIGEDPRAAALRELEEETAVSNVIFLAEAPDWLKYEFPPELRGRSWKGRWRGQMQKWFAYRHLGDDNEIDVMGVDMPEFRRWQWVDLDDVPRLIVEFKRPVYEALVKTFRRHLG
ncbi:MAG: RNA pyrophosphohydrolase [Alphaproteobacteria bacterium]|nr:RNA pyrophosphohydrolase [Alphaproteobacteria bacterium]HCP01618.1 RNA pyrophosphohydrolase [Rhodospirillaceae bacterium]